MTRVSDKVFDLAIKLYACTDADMHDANAIRLAVAELERENKQIRADLREALELLRWASPDMDHASWDEWGSRANVLLEKHKETP